MKKLLTLVLLVSSSGALAADDTFLKASAMRRLDVISALRAVGVADVVLELIRKAPETVVLSRLSRDEAQWTIELRRGSKADLEAMLATLVGLKACASPSVTQSPAGLLTGTCKVQVRPHWHLAKAIVAGPAPAPEITAVLKERVQEARSILPDSSDNSELELQLADVGSVLRGIALAAPPRVTGPVATEGPLDRFTFTVRGTADFQDAAELLAGVENFRRKAVVEAFEFQNPRVKDGTWMVDFTLRASTWRYRVEEEQLDQSYSFVSAGDPALIRATSKGHDNERPRNLFATGEPVFAGSKRALTGLECGTPKATAGGEGLDRDTVAIAWLVPGVCAMLVDDQGGCHQVRRNEFLGSDRAKVTSINPKGIAFTRFAQLPSGHVVSVKRELQLTSKAKPPQGACSKE